LAKLVVLLNLLLALDMGANLLIQEEVGFELRAHQRNDAMSILLHDGADRLRYLKGIDSKC